MNKIIHIQLKYILLFVAAFIVLIGLVFSPEQTVSKKEISTETIIEVKKKVDSITVDYGVKIPEKVLFPVKEYQTKTTKPNKVEQIKNDSVIEANQYKDTVRLKNGTVISNIITTGKVLAFDLKLINYDSIFHTRTTIKETKFITENTWFINYEPKFTMFPEVQILAHEISIDYTIKNKFRIGLGMGYNAYLPNQKFYTGIKIGFRLWK